MFPDPPLITVELVMSTRRDTLKESAEINVGAALATLSMLIVPALLSSAMQACNMPAQVTAAATLACCGILSHHVAVGRARRRQRDILLNFRGYWRLKLRKSDPTALSLLVDAMRATQKNIWVLSVHILPFTMLGLAGITYHDLLGIASHTSEPVALSLVTWFTGVGVATWHVERKLESLLKHHHVVHFC